VKYVSGYLEPVKYKSATRCINHSTVTEQHVHQTSCILTAGVLIPYKSWTNWSTASTQRFFIHYDLRCISHSSLL